MAQAGVKNPAYTHGHTAGKFSPEYHTWSSMWQRCTNPKRPAYKHYGGRGVKIDPRWKSFEKFSQDMGPRPAGTSLDRIDNDGMYCKQNCRWATRTQQARNSSQAVWVTLRGESRRLVEWCEVLKISINTVRARVKYQGMSYRQALTKPTKLT